MDLSFSMLKYSLRMAAPFERSDCLPSASLSSPRSAFSLFISGSFFGRSPFLRVKAEIRRASPAQVPQNIPTSCHDCWPVLPAFIAQSTIIVGSTIPISIPA